MKFDEPHTTIHELDTVVITRDIAPRGIVAGDVGVVAHLYARPLETA